MPLNTRNRMAPEDGLEPPTRWLTDSSAFRLNSYPRNSVFLLVCAAPFRSVSQVVASNFFHWLSIGCQNGPGGDFGRRHAAPAGASVSGAAHHA